MTQCTRLMQHQLSSGSTEAGSSHNFGQVPMQEAAGQDHLSVQTPSRGAEASSLRLGNPGESFQVQANGLCPQCTLQSCSRLASSIRYALALLGADDAVTVNSKAALGMECLMPTARL